MTRDSRRVVLIQLAAAALIASAVGQEPRPAAAVEEAAPQKEAPSKLFYTGEPLVVPLQCRSDDLLQAGLVCNEDSPCELLLELVDVGVAGEKVFVIGNVRTSAATVSSILLLSEDHGTSWREPAQRIGGAGFELIDFVNDQHGWIGGQAWDLDTSARPFLLATDSGGDRWERHDVWNADDDRSGAILDFHFETPRHGFLVIDRLTSDRDPYELYESMNGGGSWHIRQVSSEKLSVERGPVRPALPEWRLRQERDSGVYEVERLVAGSWVRAARFSSHVGTCFSMDTDKPKDEETAPSRNEPSLQLSPAPR